MVPAGNDYVKGAKGALFFLRSLRSLRSLRAPFKNCTLLALVRLDGRDLLSFERVVIQRQRTGQITGQDDTGNPVSLSHAAGALSGPNSHSDFKHLMFRTR